MDIWLESTIKAHSFISETYWHKNYEVVKNQYLPRSETYVYLQKQKIMGFTCIQEQNNDDTKQPEYMMHLQ